MPTNDNGDGQYRLPSEEESPYMTRDEVRAVILNELQNRQSLLRVGGGNQVFVSSNQGIQLGSGTFSSAPFHVDMSGNLTATSATINGTTFQANDVFGSGVDGDATISSNTTLTKDTFYNNLTVTSSSTLNPGGYRVFVKGTLTIDSGSKIARNGNNGGNGTDGSGATTPGTGGSAGAALADGSIFGSLAGAAGGAGGQGGSPTGEAAGTAGTAGQNVTTSFISAAASATGGTGGSGKNGGAAAGGGGTAGSLSSSSVIRPYAATFGVYMLDFAAGASIAYLRYNAGSGAGGGGGGGRGLLGISSGSGGGGGGGSGSNGGTVVLSAKTIVNNGSIEAAGGSGGSGGSGGQSVDETYRGGSGGGGSGGAGGVIMLIYSNISGTGTISAAGGAAGTGGAGSGTNPGSNGAAGPSGVIIQLQV